MSDGHEDPGDSHRPPPPPSEPPEPRAPSTPDQAAVIPGGHTLAEPWTRIGARLIDGLILGAVSLVIAAVLIDTDDIGTGLNIGFFVVSILVAAAYEIGFVGSRGGTPGKLLLRLRVVTQEAGTSPPGYEKAGLRYLPDLASAVPVVGTLISLGVLVFSLFWLFRDERRRDVYDRVAGTYVVRI